jgi:hypothetical protein
MKIGRKSWLVVALVVALVAVAVLSVAVAAGSGFTLAGENNMQEVVLASSQVRVDAVYKIGDRVFINKPNLILVPVSDGDSMLPMVSKGHKILVDPTINIKDIQIGDFIVAETAVGRYFHQVVGKKFTDKWALFTRGINNSADDIIPVFQEDLVGVAIAVIW